MQLASFDGKRYGGRFETEQEVGHGGMGAVYRARDLQTGEYVALKVLYERQGPNAERFEEEAAMLSELSHPAIVRYVQHGLTPGGEHFLAMEWLEGKNLEEALLAGRVPLADGLEMVSRIMDALATAHRRGMVHRDLKPANIYLPQGKLTQAKLLDFGIARRLFDGRRLTRVGATVGTPMYMAPEQARGLSDVDARADVFSLGCVLFEALTGEPPFIAETPAAVLAKICLEAAPLLRTRLPEASEDVEALLARMLEKDRENRPGDSSALSRLLLKHADDLRFGPRTTRTATDEEALVKVTPDESRLLAALVVELPRKGPKPSPSGAVTSPPLAAGPGLTPVSLTAVRRLWRKSVETPVPPPGQSTPTDRPALNAETLPELFDEVILAKIVANLAPFGVHVEPFANGGLAIARPEGPASLDQVVDMARCALEMRRMLPVAVLAVASGRAKPGEADLPIAHVLERAGALLPGAPAGTIRLDPLTAELLTTRFEIQKVTGEHGEDRRLMFEKGLKDPPRTLMGRPVPCLGREREITSIQSLFQQVVSDQQARVQILTGVAGVGKSRVRFEALERIYGLQLPFVILTARAESFRANVAWALLGAALRGAADLSGHEAVEVSRNRFSQYVGRRFKEPEARRRVVAFLGEIAGVHYPDEDFPLLASARQDPRAMSDQTRAAWLDWMEAELAAQPVLLVLEDLHWGDAASFHLVDAALRLFHDKPLMVVGFSRPELKQRFPGLWADRAVEHVALSPLTPKMTRKLVAAAYPGASPDLCEQLAERSDGNPFFVEELVRAHAERGLDVTDGAAPFSILALIQDRLDLYGENAKRVLRAASIYGQSFRRSAVAALLGSESLNDVEHWLEHLSDRELVYRRVQGADP
ncbi:MAG: protein kinase [Myxococcales bacterium]|nr:protein kinase [Myxococcales bacterium]